MKVWAFIPARGGSQGIPGKNLVPLGGHPLLSYVLSTIVRTKNIDRIILSTDDDDIAAHADTFKGVSVTERPEHLRDGVSYPVSEVVLDFMERQEAEPDLLVLVQPSSPFITPGQIEKMIQVMSLFPAYQSAQTICKVPHNFHWMNTRILENGEVKWKFPKERALAYNEQKKPPSYKFGNLVVVRPSALKKQGFFASPSYGLEISRSDSLDIDTPEDLQEAENYIQAGLKGLWGVE